MKDALYILFGAAFTVSTAFAVGLLLFHFCSIQLRRLERGLLAFVTGSAVLSAIVFGLCATRLARKGVFLAVGAIAIGAAVWLGAVRSPELTLPAISRRWRWTIAIVFGAFTVLYFFNAMAPEMSPDGTAYHLPYPAAYYRAHGFVRITYNIYANISQGIEMLFLFAYAFGRYSAATLIHFTYLAVLPWLMICYGRRFGHPAAGCAGALFVFASPVVGMDGSSAYVDVALATILFALFYLLQIWDAERDSKLLIPIGILAGFSFAVKYTAVLAIPYTVGFLLWKLWRDRQPMLRPLAVVGTLGLVSMLPWLAKNWLWTGNPVEPFANRIFPNPYVHVSFEEEYRKYQRIYTLTSLRQIPYELTISGYRLCGMFGPLYLLTPLALLALRFSTGRRLLAAGAVFALPYLGNIGTRFLIPAVPFLSIALALALSGWEWLLLALVATHAISSWPDVAKYYCSQWAWRLEKIPIKQALRIEPEGAYLSRRFPAYLMDQEIQNKVPPTGQVFSFSQVTEAYTTRRILVKYLSAPSEVLGDILWTPLFEGFQPGRLIDFAFPERTIRKLRAVRTIAEKDTMWSVSEFRVLYDGQELPRQPSWRLTASPNPWDVQLAFDNSPVTRWRTWDEPRPGMYIEVDFDGPRKVDAVTLESPPDTPETAIRIEGMDEHGQWSVLSEKGVAVQRPITYNLRRAATEEFKARGVRYLLLGNDDIGAEDFQQHAAFWGIHMIADRGYAKLYYIE